MEQSFLAWLRGRCQRLPQVALGIGDDAAIIDLPASRQIVTCVDTITDGVDFLAEQHSLADIGHKALAVNLSDIAAMAADPIAALVAISLPRERPTQIAAGVYDGLLATAERFGVSICGGDITCYDGPLSISLTMIAAIDAGKAWKRSGAESGDAVLVTGPLGGSILGHHLRFTPRVALAQRLREIADIHACIDISDGLLLDLDRLAAASGCGVELSLDQIPISEDAEKLAAQNDTQPIDHALGDGEDYELLMTCSPSTAERLLADPQLASEFDCRLTQIGNTTGRTGLWSRLPGKLQRLSPQGFVHGS